MISYKTLLACCLIFFSVLCGNAQESTYYYKQIRVVKDGNDIATPSGGQFISFFSSVCYESDNKGISVGHGILEKKSSGQYVEYRGQSYWGTNTLFKFNSSLDRLNVVTQDGIIYVYTRATAPTNVTTCSLIKGKSSSSSSSTTKSSGTSQNKSTHSTYTPEYGFRDVWVQCAQCHGSGKCWSCHGNGWCVSTRSDGSYNSTYQCNICHGTGNCTTCYGTGGHYEKQQYQIR